AVPDRILADGVTALKESRFVYPPPVPSFARTLATIWVRRGTYGKRAAAALAVLALLVGGYFFGGVAAREWGAPAAHSTVAAEAKPPAVRERADAILAQGRAALERGNAVDARAAIAELDRLA